MSEADAWESNADIAADDGTAVSFGRKQVRQTVKPDTSDIAQMTLDATAKANVPLPLKGG